MKKAGPMALLFCAHFAAVCGQAVFGPALPSFRGLKEEGKPPYRQTAKEGGGWMPAGFGRAGARICHERLRSRGKVKSDTETGVSLLHLI